MNSDIQPRGPERSRIRSSIFASHVAISALVESPMMWPATTRIRSM
jgi:hypothetical protein